MSARVLEKTVQYFYYKLRHTNHNGPLPEFKIEPEFALELLMAANYLDTCADSFDPEPRPCNTCITPTTVQHIA